MRSLSSTAPSARRSAASLCLLLALTGCQVFGQESAVPEPEYWPTEGWRPAPPETRGFDSARLAEGLRAIRTDGTPAHSLMLIRDGYVLLDANFYPYDRSTVHDLASITKSVMTTLIGIAADQGKLALDDPMVSFFPGRTIASLDDRKQRITVRYLASMTSGLECDPTTDVNDLREMWASDDWVQFSLDRPVITEPGTKFGYCGPSIHLLSAILQQATRMTALEFAQETLFGPLGINEVRWPSDPQGTTRGWGDMCLFPDDAAKLGLLMLQGGRWDGRQIVSADWVAEATQLQVATGPGRSEDYGYGWWISRSSEQFPFFAAEGRGGQFIHVYTTLNLVLATTGGGFEELGDVSQYVAAAIGDLENPLPASPDGVANLESAVREAGTAPVPAAVPPPAVLAQTISGWRYILEQNPLQIRWFRLDFTDTSEAVMQFEIAGEAGPRSIPVGLDGRLHTAPVREGLLGGAQGEWTDADTFVVEYDEIARIDAWTMSADFRGDQMSLQVAGRSSPGVFRLEGTAEPLD